MSVAVMVRIHFARYGKVLCELAYNGSETSGPENSHVVNGAGVAICPIASLLVRARLAVDRS